MAESFRWAKRIIVAEGTDDAAARDFMGTFDMARYMKDTQATILEIMKYNWTGYGIIQGIEEIAERTSKEVVIVPLDPRTCNADAGEPSWKNDRQIQIRFTPFGWGDGKRCEGALPDEVLLHELIHAYRRLWSRSRTEWDVTVSDFHYDNFEEFVAVVVTNIYSSERFRSRLRKDHFDFRQLPIWLHDGDQFLKLVPRHAFLIDKLVNEEQPRGLCDFMRKANGRFNPVRYFMDYRAQFADAVRSPNLDPDLEKQAKELLEKANKLDQKKPPSMPRPPRPKMLKPGRR